MDTIFFSYHGLLWLVTLARRLLVFAAQIKYSDIPGFPFETTVVGHKGEVVIGQLSGVTTICFRGRFHSYEGHPLKRVVLPGRKSPPRTYIFRRNSTR